MIRTSQAESSTFGPTVRIVVAIAAVTLLFQLMLIPSANAAPPYEVNSTGDATDQTPGDGVCSTGVTNSTGATECTLRAAIVEANLGAGGDVTFNIPVTDSGHSAGVWSIIPSQNLPPITSAINIDGSTQPGWIDAPVIDILGQFQRSTGLAIQGATGARLSDLAIGLFVDNPVLVTGATDTTLDNLSIGIWADGASFGTGGVGLMVTNGSINTALTNSVVSSHYNGGILINGATTTGTTIDGSFISTDRTGTISRSNNNFGIRIENASDTVIGGVVGNIISGGSSPPLTITDAAGTEIYNNRIGVSATGSSLGNSGHGILLRDATTGTVIGANGRSNIIGANAGSGIRINGASDTDIAYNYIGTDQLRNDLGNGSGINVLNGSGTTTITNNDVFFHASRGINAGSSLTADVLIAGNQTGQNSGMGIDLGGNGHSPNDPGDADTGVNGLLNYPVITSATSTTVNYDLDVPAGNYTVWLYENPTGPGAGGRGEGEAIVASQAISHPGGLVSYSFGGLSLPNDAWIATQISSATTGSEYGASTQVVGNLNSNTVDPIPNQNNTEADTISLTVTGTPAGAAPLVWSATGLPDGLSINPTTGEISGTLSYTSAGTTLVTVTASSSDAQATSQSFLWSVANLNRPPILNPISNQATTTGTSVSLSPTGSDPDGDSVTWAATGLPPGVSINPISGQLTGIPTTPGTSQVSVTVTDPFGDSDTEQFTWTVTAPPNQPPTISPIPPQTNTEGDAVSIAPTATDPDGDTLTWSAIGLPPGIAINPITGEMSGTAAVAGTYVVQVSASDGEVADTRTFSWLVEPPLPPTTTTTTAPTTTTTIPPTTTTTAPTTTIPPTTTTTVLPTTATTIPPTTTTTAPATTIAPTTTTTPPTTTTTTTPTTTTPPTTTPTTTPPTTAATTTGVPTTTSGPVTVATTAAPTSTTQTTPTTSTSAPTSTSTTSVTEPETSPSATSPDELAFVDLLAKPDSYAISIEEQIIEPTLNDVGSNGLEILSITSPEVGNAVIRGNTIVVSLPPSFAGETTFSYTVTDETGATSEAVIRLYSVNVLADQADSTTPTSEQLSPVEAIATRATRLFDTLLQIRLSLLQLATLSAGPAVAGLLFLFRRRDKLLSVDQIDAGATVSASSGRASSVLGHDALVWSRTRRNSPPKLHRGSKKILVEAPGVTRAQIPADRVVDTGY